MLMFLYLAECVHGMVKMVESTMVGIIVRYTYLCWYCLVCKLSYKPYAVWKGKVPVTAKLLPCHGAEFERRVFCTLYVRV